MFIYENEFEWGAFCLGLNKFTFLVNKMVYFLIFVSMMTSSNGNIFNITDPLGG